MFSKWEIGRNYLVMCALWSILLLEDIIWVFAVCRALSRWIFLWSHYWARKRFSFGLGPKFCFVFECFIQNYPFFSIQPPNIPNRIVRALYTVISPVYSYPFPRLVFHDVKDYRIQKRIIRPLNDRRLSLVFTFLFLSAVGDSSSNVENYLDDIPFPYFSKCGCVMSIHPHLFYYWFDALRHAWGRLD